MEQKTKYKYPTGYRDLKRVYQWLQSLDTDLVYKIRDIKDCFRLYIYAKDHDLDSLDDYYFYKKSLIKGEEFAENHRRAINKMLGYDLFE